MRARRSRAILAPPPSPSDRRRTMTALDPGSATITDHEAHQVSRASRAGYSKLFPELPPLSSGGSALSGMGRPGGLCDLGVVTPDGCDSGGDAVWPFFGQFV